MHHIMVQILVFCISIIIVLVVAMAMNIAASKSGSWQRISNGQTLVFRSPWTRTVGGTMTAVPMIALSLFLEVVLMRSPGVPPAVPLWIYLFFAYYAGIGLLVLVLLSPEELQIDRQEKTYRYTRPWLTPWRKGKAYPLTDCSGVCATSQNALLLVFHQRRGMYYGRALGLFANRVQAQEQAQKFSDMTGLPTVADPRRKIKGFAA